MAPKISTILSALLTLILLVAVNALLFFVQIALLNGFSSSQANLPIALALTCLGITTILGAAGAAWFTRLLIAHQMNPILAALIATITCVIIGAALSFGGIFISIFVAAASLP